MKITTKTLLYFFIAATMVVYSCKKKEGCTDSTALNYDADAEEDDGSCTFETTDNNNSNSGNGDGNSGGTDGTTVSTGLELDNGTLSEGGTISNLREVKITSSGSQTTITVHKKGETNATITIVINGNLPSTTTSYAIYDPNLNSSSCSLTITNNGNTWVANDALASENRNGKVTIEPLGNEWYKFYFGNVPLGDSKTDPSMTVKFAANFTLRYYQGEFRINSDDLLTASSPAQNNVTCTKSGSSFNIDVTGSRPGHSGSMEISLPAPISAGTYDITKSDVELGMTVDFVDYVEDNLTNPADFLGDRYINVSIDGDTLSYDFIAVQLLDPQGIITWVSGSGECLLD